MRKDDARMTFTEHLAELRQRLMISVIVVIISFFVCYAFSNQLFELLIRPLVVNTEGIQIQVLNPLEAVWVKLQLALYAALFICLPIIVYEVCAFIFPGLKPTERRVVHFFIFGGGGLALAGIVLAYFEVLPQFLPMIIAWAPQSVQVDELRMNETVAIIIKFMLGFAIAFQFPMVVFVLVYLGLLTPAALKKHRRFAIVLMAIAAAVLTPGPDLFSMGMMFVPLYLLYEASIWLSYLIVWRRRKSAAEAP